MNRSNLINVQDEGFAGFYESETKTISPLNRIKDVILPELDAVRTDYDPFLDKYETVEVLIALDVDGIRFNNLALLKPSIGDGFQQSC